MSPHVHIGSYLVYEELLDDTQIREASGALVHGLPLDQPIPKEKYAETVNEEQIYLNAIPSRPVIKMAKKKDVDSFFLNGTLRLGTFSYYNRFDHEEIGDTTEARFILVGRKPSSTAFTEIAGGFNNYVFCCFSGEVDERCIRRFGYDDSYEIIDVAGFSRAISKKLDATGYCWSECVYSKDKVIVGRLNESFRFDVLSAHLINLANEAKYFVKPNTYSHQSEFRLLFQVESDVDEPIDLDCPEAVQFCRRSTTSS